MASELKTQQLLPFQKELIEILKLKFSLHAVYLLSTFTEKEKQLICLPPKGKQTKTFQTFTLFIVTYKPVSGNLGVIMDDLYNKMQQKCRIQIITLTTSETVKQLNYGSNFLLNVFNNTNCIYKEDDRLEKYFNFGFCRHPKIYKEIKRVWKHRMKRAESWLESASADRSIKDQFIDFGMYHYSLEQICVALIYIHWEYAPSYYNLSYLMHLCRHFTDLPKQYFLKNSHQSKKTFYMLNNGQHDMRFKAFPEYSKKDSEKAYQLCEQFFNEAKVIGKQRLKAIKPLHYSI